MDRREHRRRRLHEVARHIDRREGQVDRRVWRRRRGARHRGRSGARGRELADLVDAKTPATAEFIPWNKSYRARGEDDVFVNATSIGLYPDVEGRVDADLSAARRDAIVADVIPNPPRTLFLREAEARGLRTLDGLGMLVNQGVVSIRHWFGVDVEASVMRRTLEDLFAI